MRISATLIALAVSGSVLMGSPANAFSPISDIDFTDAIKNQNDPRGKVVEVINKMPGNWRVKSSVQFVDKYTTSKVKFVKRCSATAWKCVTIKPGRISTDHIGWEQSGKVTIDINKAKRYGYAKSVAFRKYLVAHEFTHAVCDKCGHSHGRNLMYPKAKRAGKYLPMKFNRDQRVTLRKY